MKKSLVILMIFTIGWQMAFAQFTYKTEKRHVNLTVAYQAILDLSSEHQLFQHGGAFTSSTSLVNKYREKHYKKTEYNRIVDRDIYMKVSVATYKREGLHHALLINAGPSFRVTLPEGIFFEFDGRVGYMRTFLKGDHFTFDGDNISATRGLGNNLISLHSTASAGWNFFESHQYPVYIYASVGLMTYFPNNTTWVLQPVFSGGLGFVISRIKETYQ